MKAATRQIESVTVIDISGRITLREGCAQLRRLIRDQLRRGCKNLLVNLGEVTHIDSSGIGELVSGRMAASNRGGQLKLLKPTQRVHDLLQITKLNTVFDIHEDEARALGSFQKAAEA